MRVKPLKDMCVRDFHNKKPLVTPVRDFTKYTQIGVSQHHDINPN